MQDDETLRLYTEESVEHLTDIENDLLAIEDAGADIDEELVNKVFRAAHTIKGGAGFMGLNKIKELSHNMENVLDLIRQRELVPNPEIVNILLLASDSLRELLINVGSSNETDISEHVDALIIITQSSLPDKEQQDVSAKVDLSFPDGRAVFTVTKYDLSSARKKGKFIYLVDYDLIHDVQQKDKAPNDILKKMEESGVILDCKVDIMAVGSLEDDAISNRIPFLVLYATILDSKMINVLLDIDESQIFVVDKDFTIRSISESHDIESEVSGLQDRADEEETEEAAFGKKAGDDIVEEELFVTEVEEKSVKELARPGEKMTPVKAEKTETTSIGLLGLDKSLRVNVSLLDTLMTLAGELVLGRNQLLQSIVLKDHHTIDASGQRLNLITSELQEAIMMTRMQPIGNVFKKFPRVVRDLARGLNKEVNLVIEGEGVEIDKTILEAISDPLIHLIRNSVDHGVETPLERKKIGKDPQGTITLNAYHKAGQVNIAINDDGKGIDPERLASIAVSECLITEEQTRTMSDIEKINLIFLPGFSTAREISDVSGRGVGMDVVKTNLDRLGGVVEIDSSLGVGTTIKIKLPLTLAIIPSQIIIVGGERYAIPQVNLEELFRISAAQVKDRIEKVGDAEVVRLRGNLLPLIRLADVIEIERTFLDNSEGVRKNDRREEIADRRSRKSPLFEVGKPKENVIPLDDSEDVSSKIDHEVKWENQRIGRERRYHTSSAINIVVVHTGALKYGLVVDELYDSEEIVVKPLGRYLKHCKGYAGATIMGDGRVALILDVAGLSQMAELTSLSGTDRAQEESKGLQNKKLEDIQSMLLFRNAEDEQFAVSLNLVERIEKIKRSDMELIGGKRVIQYLGGSLPLFSIEDVAQVKPMAVEEDLLVIVFVIAGKNMGLLAAPPLDAIEKAFEIDDTTLKQTGVLGSAIIEGLTTQIVDIFGLVDTLNPEWFAERETVQAEDGSASTVLYAEDSNFFRNMVTDYLKDSGYEVIEAEDGEIAWKLLQKYGNKISLVVTDITMPNMDGIELSELIRNDNRFSYLPIIALTTLADDEDIIRGESVGINDYQTKMDREKFMDSVNMLLKGD